MVLKHPLGYRSQRVVALLFSEVADAVEPVLWREAGTSVAGMVPRKTVENVLYEMISFGLIYRLGKPADGRRPDTRALKATALGRAWFDDEGWPVLWPEDQAEATGTG
jgi:hypothetical protein